MIREILISFGASAADANKYSTDLYSYEKRIAEITPNLEALQDPISTCNTRRISELMADIKIVRQSFIL